MWPILNLFSESEKKYFGILPDHLFSARLKGTVPLKLVFAPMHLVSLEMVRDAFLLETF